VKIRKAFFGLSRQTDPAEPSPNALPNLLAVVYAMVNAAALAAICALALDTWA
jgi:hypothetical protein